MSQIFEEKLSALGITLTDVQKQQFDKFYELLVEWNKVMNLTGITEYEEVNEKHFVDSVSIVKAIDINKYENVIDIGTGAGFPGIPLKIAFPDLKIVLLDSLNKRINFLNTVIDELGLEDIKTTFEIICIMSQTKTLHWFYSIMGLEFRIELIPIYIINVIKFILSHKAINLCKNAVDRIKSLKILNV